MKLPVVTFILAGSVVSAACCSQALAQSGAPAIAPGAEAPNGDNPSGSLSDKLDKSNGVIRPQSGVDPKMQKPAPATGSMPVIAPPGAPGGATDVQPK